MIDPAETMRQFDALDARYVRLRASHDALLAAAKRAVLVMKDTRILGVGGRIDIAIEDLQAAIAKAEELAK
jgi:hypothetical protein